MHISPARPVAFVEDLKPDFQDLCAQIVKNAKALAAALQQRGYRLVSGGTDNHLMLIDLRPRSADLTGIDAAASSNPPASSPTTSHPQRPASARVTSGLAWAPGPDDRAA